MTLKSGIIGIWIIATGILIAMLYLGRSILGPLALAVFLFLVIEGFAREIDERSSKVHRGASRVAAILLVLSGFTGFIVLLGRGVAQFGEQASDYEEKINNLIGDVYGVVQLGRDQAPKLSELLFDDTGQRFIATIANATGDLMGDLVVILIYVAFLFVAQSSWPDKLDRIFPASAAREQARAVSKAARRGIETYLWTQTVISAIITVLTYFTLLMLGVENAMFLAALIFVLNYIPTIGSIVAAFVPPLFALVQPEVADWIPGGPPNDSYIFAGLVLAGVSFWQFTIGNFLQPRLMGESLNLSALVVLISLAVWGAIWGIPGMFLSAPLTVLMMILFAQGRATYWIAVLLSANGDPAGQGLAHQDDAELTSADT